MDSLFHQLTSSSSWATVVDSLKTKRDFIIRQLKAGNYDVIVEGGETGAHFTQLAQEVQREMEKINHEIEQNLAEAQAAADHSIQAANQLAQLPPPSIPANMDVSSGPLLSFLAQRMAENVTVTPTDLIICFSALQAQIQHNHNAAMQLCGHSQQRESHLLSTVASQNAAYAFNASALQNSVRSLNQMQLLLSQTSESTRYTATIISNAQLAASGALSLRNPAPQLPPPQHASLAPSEKAGANKRKFALIQNRVAVVQGNNNIDADLPVPPVDLPACNTWILMQHIVDGSVTPKEVILPFQLSPDWIIPGRIFGKNEEGQLQVHEEQWAGTSWFGASWEGRTIKVGSLNYVIYIEDLLNVIFTYRICLMIGTMAC